MVLRLPAKDAGELIESLNIPGIDYVYVDAIPPDYQSDENTTDVLVTEVTDILGDYGSDVATNRDQTIALNIFYSVADDVDTALIEKSIEAVFLHAKWQLTRSDPHVIDPDTMQVTKIYQFTRHERNDY